MLISYLNKFSTCDETAVKIRSMRHKYRLRLTTLPQVQVATRKDNHFFGKITTDK